MYTEINYITINGHSMVQKNKKIIFVSNKQNVVLLIQITGGVESHKCVYFTG